MAKLEAANLSLMNMRLKEPRTIHGIGKGLLHSILSMVKDTIRYDITKNARLLNLYARRLLVEL